MTDDITISRQELYKLVWSKPVVKIAKEFGISDVAVAKICKKMNIPKPGLGYWAKKKYGKRTKTKPLPTDNEGGLESYTISKWAEPDLKPESEAVRKHREYESLAKNIVIVKSKLSNAHPLVQISKAKLSNPNTDRYKRCYGERGGLNISVSKSCISRALLIMDALIKALSKRGYETSLAGGYDGVTTVNVDGEEFNISIQEASKRILADDSGKKRERYSFEPMYDYVPTGRLTLQITNLYYGDKSVKDSKTQRIEDNLNSFILMLIKAAEHEKARRKEREIENREYEARVQIEQEIRNERKQEQHRVKELFDNAATWNKCVLVRDYIAAVQSHGEGESDETELDSWVLWANQQVDTLESGLWQFPNSVS
jgi:hypothetical protein